jgi:hypothetical protein
MSPIAGFSRTFAQAVEKPGDSTEPRVQDKPPTDLFPPTTISPGHWNQVNIFLYESARAGGNTGAASDTDGTDE